MTSDDYGHGPGYTATYLRIRDEVAEPARALLDERGWPLAEFVEASLALALANPDAYLARLEHFRTRRRRGRPAQG